MKSRISFIIIICLLLICGCGKINTTHLPMKYISFDDGDASLHKYLNGSLSIEYKNKKNEYIELNVIDFNIDLDDLIAGDSLEVMHYGSCIIQSSLPSQTYISGRIKKIEVNYANIYEVIITNEDNKISFEHVDKNAEIEIFIESYNYFCISKLEEDICRKEINEYESGTKLYYVYNHYLNNPYSSTYMYDYFPR